LQVALRLPLLLALEELAAQVLPLLELTAVIRYFRPLHPLAAVAAVRDLGQIAD
jgi:hypothetical protein